MADEAKPSFDELVAYRQELYKFCGGHVESLTAFHRGISFKLNTGERKLEKKKARHLSSSATCVESLLECPPILWSPNSIDPLKLARDFALAALKRSPKKWTSDGSAPIYCRCRTLLLVVKHLPQYQSGVQKHLETILSQLERDPARFAVGEAWGKNPQNWYPANAFHTYWTLCLLSVFQKRFPDEFEGLCTALKQARYDIKKLHDEMLMWAHEAAGYQVALHTSESSTLDSDQLAWSLAIVITFGKDFQADLAQQDFISAALACLFQHQTDAGIWRRGAPLFHYRESGNAYCYIFETFAVLLRSALTNRKEAFFLRRALFPYVTKLLKLWRYAISTKIRLFEDKEIFGWSSGHRVNRKSAESWATASVYSFSQCLRRLIGIWAREEAAKQLKVVTSRESRKQALEDITLRGDTWASKGTTAATQLMIMFVNPFEMVDPTDELEPDSQPIRDDQARAAILFGPPGTSKTTLAKAIANAVGWDYVELHASHFVAEGLPNVQRTADAIFEKLKQLDRTVILFDEIDELVRAREHEIDGLGRAREQENDAFGRFLTTSMLPKLAELWKRQKVIYFVATNHIEFFDPAIIRAQRFDALIRVPPPSFKRKLSRLTDLLKQSVRVNGVRFKRRDIDKAVESAAKLYKGKKFVSLPKELSLARLLLIRWDQLDELAAAITERSRGKQKIVLTRQLMENALASVSDRLLGSCKSYKDFLDSAAYEQHDFRKIAIWKVKGSIPAKWKSRLLMYKDQYFYKSNARFGDFTSFPPRSVAVLPDGFRHRK